MKAQTCGRTGIATTVKSCHLGMVTYASWLTLALAFVSPAQHANAQLIDSLDAYPPRWSLHESDCDAKVAQQGHENDPSADGGVCETITMITRNGTEAILIYPIEPVRPIDELTATVSVKGLHPGIQIGLRVRFPYLMDPVTRRPASVMVFGSAYRRVGEFQRLGIGSIGDPLRLKIIALRNEFGVTADVSSPYVDAVVINAYGGPGNATLRLDALKVDAMVPITPDDGSTNFEASELTRGVNRLPVDVSKTDLMQRNFSRFSQRSKSETGAANGLTVAADRPAFPLGRVTRIVQYNNEPLGWIRSMGFDAIWLAEPPTASILSDAIANRLLIYAPCPSVPDPRLEPLLEPVAGWIAAPSIAMDSHHRDEVGVRVDRLRKLPRRWRRPIVGSPVEDFRYYGAMLDAAVLTSPPRIRALSSREIRRERMSQTLRLGGKPVAVSVMGMPNAAAVQQTDAIAGRIGTPPSEAFRWQSMWREVADAMADAPAAVLVRSTRSLASGTTLDQNRAMAISFINRFVASIEKWISVGTPDPTPATSDNFYTVHRLVSGPTTFLIGTSAMIRGPDVMAGDGKTLRIEIPGSDQGKLMWRLTHFAAERIEPVASGAGGPSLRGSSIEIVSPDVVEIIAISDRVSEGGQLSTSMAKFAQQAALDRWQLARDAIQRSQTAWSLATSSRAVARDAPLDFLNVAQTTIGEAETFVRGADVQSALRLAARADAWGLKADWMLRDAMREDSYGIVSCPPIDAGNMETQIAWTPLLGSGLSTTSVLKMPANEYFMDRSRWGVNRLGGGDMDRPDGLETEGWTFGRRHAAWANTSAECVQRDVFHGTGALSVRVTPTRDDAMPGGYEGTALLVRSPPILVDANQAVRIDAVVRTLGFGGPHQGVLMYDSLGTQEMGVLIRDRAEWTPVTLYRQTVGEAPLHVMFEVIGGGEAVIDEIQVRVWENEPSPRANMRPISMIQGEDS